MHGELHGTEDTRDRPMLQQQRQMRSSVVHGQLATRTRRRPSLAAVAILKEGCRSNPVGGSGWTLGGSHACRDLQPRASV